MAKAERKVNTSTTFKTNVTQCLMKFNSSNSCLIKALGEINKKSQFSYMSLASELTSLLFK